MADDSDQLLIEIGADSSGFTASLADALSKTTSIFGSIERQGAKSAASIALAFAKIGSGSPSLTLLNHGLQLAEANGSKLAKTLLNVQRAESGLQKAALGKVLEGELALLKKIQASGGVKQAASSVASSLGGVVGPALAAGVGAFAGYEALKFTLDEIVKAAQHAEAELAALVKIGDDAKGSGVGTTFFQQFTEGSKKLGLEAEDLTAILDNLKSASMVSLGSGDNKDPTSSAQDAIAAEIAAGNLKNGDGKAFDAAGSQEDRLRAALALISELQQKGAQLAALDLGAKLFGGDFEAKLRGDTDLVAKLQARLKDMAEGKGINVIPPEQIAAARELQAQIEDMNNRIQNALVPFHNDLRGWQQDELRSVVQLKEYWTEIVEVFGQLYKWCDNIGKTISGWGNAGFFQQIDSLLDRMGMLKDGDGLKIYRDKAGNVTTLDKARADGTEPPAPSTEHPLTITRPKGDTSKPLPETTKIKKEKDDDDDDGIEDFINGLKKETAAEEAQVQTLGMSNKAKAEALDIAKAQAIAAEHDATLTADETAQIKAQADALTDAKAKVDAFNKSQEQAKAQAAYFGQEFESSVEKLVLGGGKLGDIFKGLVKSLEEAALKAALLGQGPLAGVFGSSTGGANSIGGGGLFGGLFGSALGNLGRTTPTASAGDAGSGIFGGLGHLLGFAEGGQISGPGDGKSDSIVARVSHGEYIVNAEATKANLPLLHALNSGKLPKFASGGMVGSVSTPSFSGASAAGAGGVNVHAPITVNGSAGTPEQNQDLASRMASSLHATMRQVASSEIAKQLRPGNMLQNVQK